MRNACYSIMKRFESISSVEEQRYKGIDDLYANNGKAICALDAAHCLSDFTRTVRFMTGLSRAIGDKLKEGHAGKLHICYAGTGPYAALMLPSLFQFSPHQIEFTLMEIHPHTYPLLLNTIEKLSLSPWIKQVLKTDATKYQFKEEDKPDIIISETMQLALRKEMQVPITLNLYPQLKPGGIYIPACIEVNISRLTKDRTIDPEFDLPLIKFEPGRNDWDKCIFTPSSVCIDPETIRFGVYYYTTLVNIYKDLSLNYNESSLTVPLDVKALNKFKGMGKSQFLFQYQISDEPGIMCTIDGD